MVEHQRIHNGDDNLDTCTGCAWASWDTSPSFADHAPDADREGWAAYAAEQERHAETSRRLEELRTGVAYMHDVYAVGPGEPRCCSDCAANDIAGELRRVLRDA